MVITYTSTRRARDVVKFDSTSGVFTWTANHKPDSLVRYIGDDGSKIEVNWGADGNTPCAYHGW